MASEPNFKRTQVAIQPKICLVDIFEESIEYKRAWCLPFNSLCLCEDENSKDPSWIDFPERKNRIFFEKGAAYFTACNTPMHIKYTTANLHKVIHFKYEIFPGVDLFSGVRDRCQLHDKELIDNIRNVFTESDPLRKVTMAEAVALKVILLLWPDHLPLAMDEMSQFLPLLEYAKNNLNGQFSVAQMADFMGWSEDYFSRKFRNVFHITPKQYLVKELLSKSLELLKNHSKTVKEISDELNFSSEFNFSRFIRHNSGRTPSDIRKGNFLSLHVGK